MLVDICTVSHGHSLALLSGWRDLLRRLANTRVASLDEEISFIESRCHALLAATILTINLLATYIDILLYVAIYFGAEA